MKKVFAVLTVALVMTACEKKTATESNDTPATDSTVIPETTEPRASSTDQTCYMSVVKKDSVFLSLEDNLGTITGAMKYQNFEKDGSHGTVIGFKNGDTLKLNYTFEAEGTTSEREIYFLQKEGNLIEGIGDHNSEGNKSTYKSPSKLTYNGMSLSSADCEMVEKHLK